MVETQNKKTKEETKTSTPPKPTPTNKTIENKPKENINKTKKEDKTKIKEKNKVEVKKKYIPKVKKENKKKSTEAVETQKTLKAKKKLPTFRGRFGKKNIRKKSKTKWNKWRKPRSIDLDRGLQHGFRPKIGYRGNTKIRGIHPSGYNEILIKNLKEIEKINIKTEAIRIGATVGKKKRNEIITKANEKGIWVLN